MSTHWLASFTVTSTVKPEGGTTMPAWRLDAMPFSVAVTVGACASAVDPVRKRAVRSAANQLPVWRRAPLLPPTMRVR